MSAYVVDPAHIRALVYWATCTHFRDHSGPVTYYWSGSRRRISGDEARVASVLYAENVRSVNSRYNESDTADGFVYAAPKSAALRNLRPHDVIGACRCYAYQSCETADWTDTEAHAIVEAIKDRAVWCMPGMDDAAWSLTERFAEQGA